MSAWRTSRSGNLLPCAHYFCGAHNSVSHPDMDVDPPAYVFPGACSLTLSLSTFSLYLSLLLFGVVRLSKKVSCLAGSVQLVTSLCLRLYLFGPDRDEKNLSEERERERERERESKRERCHMIHYLSVQDARFQGWAIACAQTYSSFSLAHASLP